MPRFPTVDDDGWFEEQSVELTKPLLGFYVKTHSVGEVEAYADGLWDACNLLDDVIDASLHREFSLEQFRKQLKEVIGERYALMECMHSYVAQTRKGMRPQREPQ